MEPRFEDALRLVQEHNLSDLIFHKKYSDDEKLQTAFLDGYSIGILSNMLLTISLKESFSKCLGENKKLLLRALEGDEEALKELENKQS